MEGGALCSDFQVGWRKEKEEESFSIDGVVKPFGGDINSALEELEIKVQEYSCRKIRWQQVRRPLQNEIGTVKNNTTAL